MALPFACSNMTSAPDTALMSIPCCRPQATVTWNPAASRYSFAPCLTSSSDRDAARPPASGGHGQEQPRACAVTSRHGRARQDVLAAADPDQPRPRGTDRSARGVSDHSLEHRIEAGPVMLAARITPPDPLIHTDARERRLPGGGQRPGSLQDQPPVLSLVPGHTLLPPGNTVTRPYATGRPSPSICKHAETSP